MWSDLKFRLSALLRRKTHENNLKDEMQFHLEQQINKHVRMGRSVEEATRLARLEFGAIEAAKEECRDARGLNLFDNMMNDLSYALRLLRKSPGFALVAILSLTLGTGVNSAVFSVIYGVLLKPLPYPAPDQLVRISRLDVHSELAMPEFEFSKQNSATLSSVAAYRYFGERQLHSDSSDRTVRSLGVSADFLRTLQLQLAIGREFDTNETRRGGPAVVIISDELWKSAMGSDPGAIGRTIRLDNDVYTIIGVLPRGYWFHQMSDILLPLRPTGGLGDKGTNTSVIARVGNGVNLRRAQAELDKISGDYRRVVAGQAANDFNGLVATPFHEWMVGDVRLNLMLLFSATGLLLLIACSNIGSLLLTRLAVRRPEFAVRLALGAGTKRLLSQLLIENLLLAGLGGIAGLVCAYAMLSGLIRIMPFELPASSPIRIDGAVLAFTVLVGFTTTLLFTIGPFFANRPLDGSDTLQTGGRTVGAGTRRHVRNALVIAEVALSALLLVSAGLLINSLYQLHQEQLGFNSSGLLMVETPVAEEHRKNASVFSEFTNRVLGSLQRDGLTKVAAVNMLPLTGRSNLPTQHFGHQDHNIGGMEIRYVTPGYFELMGIPVKHGRAFTEGDARSSSPVAIVSEIVARRWWPGSESLGDRVIIGRFGDQDFKINDSPREVIGVVGDIKAWDVKDPPRPTLYIPIAQIPANLVGPSRMAWVMEATNASAAADAARRALANEIPANEIGLFRTVDDLIDSNLQNWRFNAWLFGVFAVVAVALSAIGIFGLLSYTVAQRRREIGMRMALGASSTDVLKLVLAHGLALLVIGLVLGISGALFATRLLATLLYRIQPNDPFSYVEVVSILLLVGILASYIPARRAAKTDPMVALRND